jgi:hypothetical protein
MTSNAIREELELAFQRIGAMDVSLDEQLKAFSDAARQKRPQFAEAVDRLVGRPSQVDTSKCNGEFEHEQEHACWWARRRRKRRIAATRHNLQWKLCK